jgi:hypothetical protein
MKSTQQALQDEQAKGKADPSKPFEGDGPSRKLSQRKLRNLAPLAKVCLESWNPRCRFMGETGAYPGGLFGRCRNDERRT